MTIWNPWDPTGWEQSPPEDRIGTMLGNLNLRVQRLERAMGMFQDELEERSRRLTVRLDALEARLRESVTEPVDKLQHQFIELRSRIHDLERGTDRPVVLCTALGCQEPGFTYGVHLFCEKHYYEYEKARTDFSRPL